ncbi:MAG TPA: heme exporter protein CcmB [Anaerolineae bacterium]|nr:heme exporter protein CcmB [Anaerolineae bacterium]HNT04662.1 heme exporter protein CcmB [Anaerolineae bacterium]
MKNAWRGIAAIVRKDLTVELRTRETLSTSFVFALLVVVIFNFAFELRVDNAAELAPGVLWVAFTFAGILALNHSMVQERESGCMEGLMLAPVERSVIYLGKFVANSLYMLLSEAAVLPLFAVLFGVNVAIPLLWLVILLGTLGFSAAGTLFSTMTVSTRAREALLPLLLFPATVPILIAATKSTGLLLDRRPVSEVYLWIRLLLAVDTITLVVAILGFDYVLEE